MAMKPAVKKTQIRKPVKQSTSEANAVVDDKVEMVESHADINTDAEPMKKQIAPKQKIEKVFYTPSNINTYLLAYDGAVNPKGLFGLLAYVFKTFSSNNHELLAKIKILTRNMNVKTTSTDVPFCIVEHIFALFKLQGDFFTCLFKLLSNTGFVTKTVVEFFFSCKKEAEESEECFDKLFEALLSKLDENATVKFADFKSTIEELKALKSLQDFVADDENSNSVESVDELKSEEEDEALIPEEKEGSTFSLISLDDEEKINALDEQFGKMFKTSELTPENLDFVSKVLKCLEIFIKNNFISEIDKLYSIMYLYQFEPFQQQVKFIIKAFITKFADKKLLFRIFQLSTITIPHVHGLYHVFKTYAEGDFDFEEYVKIALKFNQMPYIFHRIEPSSFYALYKPTLGEEYDEMYSSLISKESNLEVLQSLSEKEEREEFKAIIKASIDRLSKKASKIEKIEKMNKRKAESKEVRISKAVKRAENTAVDAEVEEESDECCGSESNECCVDECCGSESDECSGSESDECSGSESDECCADEEEKSCLKPSDSIKEKKKSFAQKIGKKLFEKKQLNKKIFGGSKGDDEKVSEKINMKNQAKDHVEAKNANKKNFSKDRNGSSFKFKGDISQSKSSSYENKDKKFGKENSFSKNSEKKDFSKSPRSGSSSDRSDRRPSFNRDDKRPSFNRDDKRLSFNRDENKSFGRSGSSSDRSDRRPSFNRSDRRPSFNRDDKRPSFNRDDKRPSFNRDDKRPSFNRDENKSFGRSGSSSDRSDRRPSFNRDERRPAGRNGQSSDREERRSPGRNGPFKGVGEKKKFEKRSFKSHSRK